LSIYGIYLIRFEKKDNVKERVNFFLLNEQSNPLEVEESEKQQSFFVRFIKPLFLDFKKSLKRECQGKKKQK
jgi:tight adherence protein C